MSISDFYCQRNKRYKGSPLGKGIGGSDLWSYGCYFISLCRGLGVDPIEFNKTLIDADLWDNNNHIKVDQLRYRLPSIFLSFNSYDTFSMDEWESWINDSNTIVVAQVDARGIGGVGTHFVHGVGRNGENAIIYDPWFGDINPVAGRYNRWGNIYSVRIFKINPNYKKKEEYTMPEIDKTLNEIFVKYGVNNKDELITKIDGELDFLENERKKVDSLEKTVNTLRGDLAKKTNDYNLLAQEVSDLSSYRVELEYYKKYDWLINIFEIIKSLKK